jgi:hypothetical protein
VKTSDEEKLPLIWGLRTHGDNIRLDALHIASRGRK